MANRSLGTLTVDLVAKVQGFREGMTEAERSAEKAAAKIRRETAKTIDTVAEWGKAAGAAAAAVGAAVAYMTTQQVAAIAAQKDLADTLGTTQGQLAGLQRAADLSGVAHDELGAAVKKLNNLIGEGQAGNKAAIATFDRLGLSLSDLVAMPVEERMAAISRAITGLGTQTERAAAMQDLFGKSGQALLPMMQDNAATLAAGAASARDLGTALSDIDVARIAEADDRMADAAAAIEGVKNAFAAEFAPILSVAAERLTGLAKDGRGLAGVFVDAFEFAAKAAGYILTPLHDAHTALLAINVTTDSMALAFNLTAMAIEQVALAIDRVLGTDTAESIKQRQQVVTGAVAASMARVADSAKALKEQWNSALPYEEVDRFFADVRAKMRDAAATAPLSAAAGLPSAPSVAGTGAAKAESPGVGVGDWQQHLDEVAAVTAEFRADQLAADKFASDQRRAMMADELAAEIANGDVEREAAEITAASKARLRAQEYANAKDALGNLSTLMNSHSRKAFELGKAASYASAIINIAEGVTKALAQGGIFGPVLAGTIVAAGAVQLQSIRAQQFGGGGSAGVAPTVAASSAATPFSPGGNAPSSVTYVNLEPGQMYSGQQLVELINDAVSRGSTLRVR